MKRRILSLFLALLMVSSVFAMGDPAIFNVAAVNTDATADSGEWIGAWGCGMTDISFADYPDLYFSAKKIAGRVVLTPTASGNKVRLRLSNVYGSKPLTVDRVRINYADTGYKVKRGGYDVYYNDSKVITIPAGEEIVTDPVDMKINAQEDIAVTMYISSELQDITSVALSGGKTYIAPFEDKIGAFEDFYTSEGNFLPFSISSSSLKKFIPALDNLPDLNIVPILSGVDAYNTEEEAFSVVVIGDSTVANDFPYLLSKKIAAEGCTNIGVVGKGIIGNSLLSDGQGKVGNIYGSALLNRMNVDVLAQSGVKYAIIKIGANDITHPESTSIKDYYGGPYEQPTAQQLIAGYESFIKSCNSYGIKVIGCTITQWNGTHRDYFSNSEIPEYQWKESDWKIALDVNEWMKKTDKLHAVYDLAELSASQDDPTYIRPEWTSDNIHPNKAAQQAWADSFPLEALGIKTVPTSVSISPDKLELSVGDIYKLEEVITPDTAKLSGVKWQSSDPTVVSVSSDGTVEALKNGKAVITCTTTNNKTAKCYITVNTLTNSVSLNKKSVSLFVTQTKKLTATVRPAAAEDKSVVWSSSNGSVASVSNSGKITAKKPGKAIITCSTLDTGASASCTVTVKKGVRVSGISLDKKKITIFKGNSYQLDEKITPSNASNKKVIWKSSNSSVAKVSSSGKITARKNGTAKITATTQDGSHVSTCKVTVKTKVKSVSVGKSSKTIYIGKSYDLDASISPRSASNKKVKWVSSNTAVATVNSKGVVTGKKAGKATITCITADGNKKDSCKFTVTQFRKTKSVSLNKKSIKLAGGKTFKLKATVNPSNASVKGVKWRSSDPSIAKVSSTGKVTAVSKGVCTITCTTKSGSKKNTCRVTVTSTPVSKIVLNMTSARVEIGESITLSADLYPLDATEKAQWYSSDESVAVVSSSGVVTGISVGDCTISYKTKSGKKSSCDIIVYENGGVMGDTSDLDSFETVTITHKGPLNLSKGETYKLTVSPSNIQVTWKSSDTSVATVSATGKVTAVGTGTCLIQCTTKNGGWTSTCQVNVK